MDIFSFFWGLLALYLVCIWIAPNIWLVVFPIFIVCIDLTPWSGAFLFNELDIYLLSTFVVVMIRQSGDYGKIGPILFIMLLLASFGLSAMLNISSLPITSDNSPNPYYSFTYGIKVFKGFVFAFALALIAYKQYRINAKSVLSNLFLGSWLASTVLFIIVLWERQTLTTIVNYENWWSIASSFLDFSTSYRITGLMSDMHTGGESFDGVLLALYFTNLLSISFHSGTYKKYFGFGALLLVIYCVLVGFTRATYAAVLIGSIIYVLAIWRTGLHSFSIRKQELLSYFCILVLCLAIFKLSGYGGFALTIIMILSIAFFNAIISKNSLLQRFSFVINLSVIIIVTYLAIQQQESSKWVNQSLFSSVLLILAIVGAGGLTVFSFKQPIKDVIFKSLSLTSLAVVLSLVFGTYQFNSRIGSTFSDIFTRFAHWETVANSSNEHWSVPFVGNGLGSFPYNYALSEPQVIKQVGSFQIEEQQLVLGYSGDLTFAQRIELPQVEKLYVEFNVASQENSQAIIQFSICQRNIIYASNFHPNCVYERFPVGRNIDQSTYRVEFDLNKLQRKSNGLWEWPWLISVKNLSRDEVVAIDNILLTFDESAVNTLKNGDFSKGVSSWFFYNDFEHLPWHIKNLFLAIYYQTGLFGILLFTYFVWALLRRIPENLHDKKTLIAISSLTYALLVFGLVGDPTDSARSTSLLFFLLFFGYLIVSNSFSYKNSLIANRRVALSLAMVFVISCVLVVFAFQFVFQKNISEIGSITLYKKQHLASDIDKKFSTVHQTDVPLNLWENSPVGPKSRHVVHMPSYGSNTYQVSSSQELKKALSVIKAGDVILLHPGTYLFQGHALNLVSPGRKDAPIKLYSSNYGDVILQFDLLEGFFVSAPYWHLENIVIEGVCETHAKCQHAIHLVGDATNFKLENSLIRNFNSIIKANKLNDQYPDNGQISNSAFFNDSPRKTNSPVTLLDLVAVNDWSISKSFIADFAKREGDLTSYGMFFKGAGYNNTFEQNLVSCEWRHQGGLRIGASLGGGGTGKTFCRDGKCKAEQFDSTIRNNIIMNCPDAAGLYINKSTNYKINNNLVYDTRGIDLRFPETTGQIYNNIIEGRIWLRDAASANTKSNLYNMWSALFMSDLSTKLFNNPYRGDFRFSSSDLLLEIEPSNLPSGPSICGVPENQRALGIIGPFSVSVAKDCKPIFHFLDLKNQ